MPKVEKVMDSMNAAMPLRITRRKSRRVSPNRTISPRIHIKCGDCDQTLNIYHDSETAVDTHNSFLEVNGVNGSVDQWRKVFAPLLGFREERTIVDGTATSIWHSTLAE